MYIWYLRDHDIDVTCLYCIPIMYANGDVLRVNLYMYILYIYYKGTRGAQWNLTRCIHLYNIIPHAYYSIFTWSQYNTLIHCTIYIYIYTCSPLFVRAGVYLCVCARVFKRLYMCTHTNGLGCARSKFSQTV